MNKKILKSKLLPFFLNSKFVLLDTYIGNKIYKFYRSNVL